MFRSVFHVLSLFIAVAFAGPSAAGAPSSTLEKIAETGTISIGYSPDAAPFSYLDNDGRVVGYSIDICGRAVDLLKQKMGLAQLVIRYVPRTPSDRVLLLKDGTIDIECVASTNNAERRKSVAFTYSHFIAATQFASLRTNGLHTIADLTGHTVASTSGTTNIGQLNTLNREKGLNFAVLPAKSHEIAFDMMADGRVSAFVLDDILLATMIANSNNPQAYALSSEAIGAPEPYGFMIRHDDLEFRDTVNAALYQIYTSGEIDAIYSKWFTAPIPPHGINLHLPISRELKAAFLSPHVIKD